MAVGGFALVFPLVYVLSDGGSAHGLVVLYAAVVTGLQIFVWAALLLWMRALEYLSVAVAFAAGAWISLVTLVVVITRSESLLVVAAAYIGAAGASTLGAQLMFAAWRGHQVGEGRDLMSAFKPVHVIGLTGVLVVVLLGGLAAQRAGDNRSGTNAGGSYAPVTTGPASTVTTLPRPANHLYDEATSPFSTSGEPGAHGDVAAGATTLPPPRPVTTTIPHGPTDVLRSPEIYTSRARITALEGLNVDEAVGLAATAGWGPIYVYSPGEPVEPRLAGYLIGVLGLYEEQGIVKEAWTGG